MAIEDDKLFSSFDKIFDIDGDNDKHPQANISLTVGVVVDTDDPLQGGRLRVFCPSLNDNPKKLQHLPWSVYCSPFSGVVNNKCFTRGSDPDNCTTTGAVHYGWWAIPEQGAHVLVGCIDGDPRRRFWLGCLPSHQETHTLFNGRYKWEGFNGTPDGPFSSSNGKIQPLYDNLSQAFNNDRTSREWKTRGADYQATAVNQNVGEVPNTNKGTYLDEQYEQISVAEPDQWVKDILGANGYDWTSFKGLGAFMASKVYGLTTPGGHTIMCDDRAFNCRIKIRTSAGHVFLLDDTNERIYMATNKGNNWMEMDASGNIDYYTKKRFSVHAEDDINFSTEGTFRVKASKGIHMYAGSTAGSPLGEIPPDGQIRMQSSDDMHIYSNKSIRQKAGDSYYSTIVNDFDVSANSIKQKADDIFLNANTISISTNGSSTVQLDTTGILFQSASQIVSSSISVQVNPPTVPPLTPIENPADSNAQISIWTNRVPQHEPWPRVMMQDGDDPINSPNNGYLNNIDWIHQFDNTSSPLGMEPIGKVEGDVTISRGMFWRR